MAYKYFIAIAEADFIYFLLLHVSRQILFPTGIPELNVPPYEPLIIPEIKLSRGPKAAKLEALTRNLSVSGPSQFIIKSLR